MQGRRILRLPAVQNKTGLGHSSIYERIAQETFPKPVPLGPRAVGWIEAEIDAWVEARIAERDAKARERDQAADKPSAAQRRRAGSTAPPSA